MRLLLLWTDRPGCVYFTCVMIALVVELNEALFCFSLQATDTSTRSTPFAPFAPRSPDVRHSRVALPCHALSFPCPSIILPPTQSITNIFRVPDTEDELLDTEFSQSGGDTIFSFTRYTTPEDSDKLTIPDAPGSPIYIMCVQLYAIWCCFCCSRS